MEFLRDVLSGKKSVFKLKDAVPVRVPILKAISVKTVYQYVSDKQKFLTYLPDLLDDDIIGFDRNFLFTIVNTIDSTYFPQQLEEYQDKKLAILGSKKEDKISIKPEMLELLNNFGSRRY